MMSDNLEDKYLKALQLEKQVFGVPHSIVANTLNRLGTVYDQQQNYELAEQYYRQSLEMSQQLFGEKHPSVAGSMNNLASLYEVLGRDDEAEALYIQAISISIRVSGDEHPNTTIIQCNYQSFLDEKQQNNQG